MKIVENQFGGLFDYTVSGKKEEQAAEELESRMKYLQRLSAVSHTRGEYILEDLSDIRRDVSEKYDVEIGTTLD